MPIKKVEINSRIVWAAVLGVVAVAFSLWYTAMPKSDDGNTAKESDRSAAQQEEALEAQHALSSDRDGDGLKDWEELLAGTDPDKQDTNDNGILDADEVRKLADLAPDDLPAGQAGAEQAVEDSEEANLTDEVTRRIFAAYMQSKQSDLYHPASMARVVQEVVGDAFDDTKSETVYTASDIRATVESTKENAENYRKSMDAAMAPVIKIAEYELTTYARAVEEKDEAEFAKLSAASRAYRTAAVNLLVVPVPKDIQEKHVNMVNAFVSFADTLKEMGEMADDPVLSFVHVRDFLQKEQKIDDLFEALRTYFTIRHSIEIAS